MDIAEAKDVLSSLLHGQDVDTLEDIELLFERTGNTLLSQIDPLETMRVATLSQTIHDDIYNYALPSDFKSLIELYPQDNRNESDVSGERYIERFDSQKGIRDKETSIESNNGTKFIRINWHSRAGTTLHNMDSVTSNGTWTAVNTASGIVANDIFKQTGSASIEFDLAATGDGIQNSTMDAIDMTDEDEVADIFVWVYFASIANLTSITAAWGNDLITKYWTSTAQTTQADGTVFQVGWNLIKFSWASATETGTVDPATIDSFKITMATTGAIANIRVDNIIFSIGRNFDMKYYSKYLFRNTSGTWISKPTSNTDLVCLDNDAIQIWHLENLIAASQESEIEESQFDLNWAQEQLYGNRSKGLVGLYTQYKKKHPSQAKKPITYYGSAPARGRW